jgi:AbrB family looped-hinge helix DNA binding protein
VIEMPERKRTAPRAKQAKPAQHRVAEARAEYDVLEDLPAEGLTRLSSKNQITIPAGMVRLMGWKSGDDIRLIARGEHIALRRQRYGQELLDYLAGSMAHVPEWRTKEDVDKWVRDLRNEWETDLDREWANTSRK